MAARIAPTALTLCLACGGPAPAPEAPELPQDTGLPRDTGIPFVPVDTGEVLPDLAPAHTVRFRQWGEAALSPSEGPFSAWTGTLAHRELLDGLVLDTGDTADTAAPVQLDCDVAWAATGVPSARRCDGCAFVFDVTLTLTSGDPSGCHDPYLPADGATWALAFHPDQGALLRDFGDAGLWLPWFPATLEGDALRFAWEATAGVALDEEEEE